MVTFRISIKQAKEKFLVMPKLYMSQMMEENQTVFSSIDLNMDQEESFEDFLSDPIKANKKYVEAKPEY